jgi:hypothetical protein
MVAVTAGISASTLLARFPEGRLKSEDIPPILSRRSVSLQRVSAHFRNLEAATSSLSQQGDSKISRRPLIGPKATRQPSYAVFYLYFQLVDIA